MFFPPTILTSNQYILYDDRVILIPDNINENTFCEFYVLFLFLKQYFLSFLFVFSSFFPFVYVFCSVSLIYYAGVCLLLCIFFRVTLLYRSNLMRTDMLAHITLPHAHNIENNSVPNITTSENITTNSHITYKTDHNMADGKWTNSTKTLITKQKYLHRHLIYLTQTMNLNISPKH